MILAAGYGTRFLPATRTVPKEMLPLLHRPALDFIVRELVDSGIGDLLVITSRRKRVLEDYFDRDLELEQALAGSGSAAARARLAPPECSVTFVRQQRMLGTGHALLLARNFVGDDPFVVAYPDDLVFGEPPLARQLIAAYERSGCSVLATVHDPPNLERYGVIAPAADGVHVAGLVEKPAPGNAPSRHASIGRYLYTPEIFGALDAAWSEHRRRGGGAEFYHTGSVAALAARGRVVFEPVRGERYDTGTPDGYLRALLAFAATLPELRPTLDQWCAQRPAPAPAPPPPSPAAPPAGVVGDQSAASSS